MSQTNTTMGDLLDQVLAEPSVPSKPQTMGDLLDQVLAEPAARSNTQTREAPGSVRPSHDEERGAIPRMAPGEVNILPNPMSEAQLAETSGGPTYDEGPSSGFGGGVEQQPPDPLAKFPQNPDGSYKVDLGQGSQNFTRAQLLKYIATNKAANPGPQATRPLIAEPLAGAGAALQQAAAGAAHVLADTGLVGKTGAEQAAADYSQAASEGMNAPGPGAVRGVLHTAGSLGEMAATGGWGAAAQAGLAGYGQAREQLRSELVAKGKSEKDADRISQAAAPFVGLVEAAMMKIPAERLAAQFGAVEGGIGAFLHRRVVDAVIGAGFGAGSEGAQQAAGVVTGAQDQWDVEKLAEAVKTGAITQAVLGGGIEALHGASNSRLAQSATAPVNSTPRWSRTIDSHDPEQAAATSAARPGSMRSTPPWVKPPEEVPNAVPIDQAASVGAYPSGNESPGGTGEGQGVGQREQGQEPAPTSPQAEPQGQGEAPIPPGGSTAVQELPQEQALDPLRDLIDSRFAPESPTTPQDASAAEPVPEALQGSNAQQTPATPEEAPNIRGHQTQGLVSTTEEPPNAAPPARPVAATPEAPAAEAQPAGPEGTPAAGTEAGDQAVGQAVQTGQDVQPAPAPSAVGPTREQAAEKLRRATATVDKLERETAKARAAGLETKEQRGKLKVARGAKEAAQRELTASWKPAPQSKADSQSRPVEESRPQNPTQAAQIAGQPPGSEAAQASAEIPASVSLVDRGTSPKSTARPFTRKDLESRILDAATRTPAYDARQSQDTIEEARAEQDQNQSAGGRFTYSGDMPGELRAIVEERPDLKRFLTQTDIPSRAGWAEHYSNVGEERFKAQLEEMAGGSVDQALQDLRESPDPEHQFLAALHDNMPKGGGPAKEALKPGELPKGATFTINGAKIEVQEAKDGYLVLRDGKDYPVTPVDALTEIPADKGSLKGGTKEPTAGKESAAKEPPKGTEGAPKGQSTTKTTESAESTALPPQEPPVTLPEGTVPEPERLTSAKNAAQDSARELRDLGFLDSPERRGWEQDKATAAKSKVPDRAKFLADEVNSGRRDILNSVESAGMTERLTQLENELDGLHADFDKAATAQDETAANWKTAEIARNQQEFDAISRALRSSGTEIARALAIRKMQLRNDYSIARIESSARMAKGKALTPQESKFFQDQVEALKSKNNELTDALAEEELKNAELTVKAEREAKARERTRKPQEARKISHEAKQKGERDMAETEYNSHASEFLKLLKEGCLPGA